MKKTWIDCHCHLADPRLDNCLGQLIEKSSQSGIEFFVQGGVDPKDWEQQILLKAKYPEKIGMTFGVHPYFAAANEEEVCEEALDLLARKIHQHQVLAIGEMGLDFRPHIMKDSLCRQMTVFENQLELAVMTQKPVILHIVQAHTEAFQVLDFFGPVRSGMVHAFNASLDVAQQYIRRGLLISVGGAVTYPKNKKLQNAVKDIPLEMLCLESDSPDQAPANWKEKYNDPTSLHDVALKIADIRGMTPFDILEISKANFHRAFGINETGNVK